MLSQILFLCQLFQIIFIRVLIAPPTRIWIGGSIEGLNMFTYRTEFNINVAGIELVSLHLNMYSPLIFTTVDTASVMVFDINSAIKI